VTCQDKLGVSTAGQDPIAKDAVERLFPSRPGEQGQGFSGRCLSVRRSLGVALSNSYPRDSAHFCLESSPAGSALWQRLEDDHFGLEKYETPVTRPIAPSGWQPGHRLRLKARTMFGLPVLPGWP
jgi:hypothetical protein